MILADKIINLRKKNGMSQEELADKLGVSRQSVSKWEGAQSIPELSKILQMAELFNVTTDYLLKDEIEEIDSISVDKDSDNNRRRVSMEEANEFLNTFSRCRLGISVGVFLCVISPITLILLSGMAENNMLSESLASAIGLPVILLLVSIAVVFFIYNGIQMNKYEYLEKEPIETEYGVSGMVKEKENNNSKSYIIELIIGIWLCITACVPLLVFSGFGNDLYIIYCVCVLLFFVAIGASIIVYAAILKGAYMRLLEEGDYSRRNKVIDKETSAIVSCYWMIVTAGYLLCSFITKRWDITWIVWPIAGVLTPVVRLIAKSFKNKK